MENHSKKTSRIKRVIWGMVWLALIALYLVAPLRHLDDYAWDYDEGPYLQAAALAFEGHPLYAKVVLNKLPYLTWLLEGNFALGGMTLATARFTILLLTSVGFVSLGILSELWWGEGAGPAAMILYLLIPESTVRAAVVMNDLPAMSAVLVALTAATLFRHSRRFGWLLTSAVAYALAVGVHPLLLFTGLPVAWILVALEPRAPLDPHQMVRVMVVFGVTGMVILGGTLLLVDRPGLLRWVYDYNTTSARSAGVSFPAWAYIRDYLCAHWGFGAAAISGGILLVLRARHRFWVGISLVWAFISLTSLYLYQPLWEHYLIFLLYPFVIVAGGGVASSLRREFSGLRRAFAVVFLCLTLVLGFQRLNTPLAWPNWPRGHEATYAYLAQEGASGEFIVSDDQFLAFVHGYLTPPALADTSFKRIRNEYLNIGDVVQAMHEYKARYLVLDVEEGRLHSFPDLMSGIEAISDPPRCFETLCVYRARPVQPADAVLGDVIRLVGYTNDSDMIVRSGEMLTVTLYWESLASLDDDLSVFTHLLTAEGTLIAQHDSPPLYGLAPTSTWQAGMVIPDPHPIIINADVAPGAYVIAVGMYRWPSLERLPARNADGGRWQNDMIVLTDVVIERP